ncbi:MAG: 50S ribosomal protein L25 [Armatimonadetes bacterium]|nr:50S ribosomal protein L25 [Armatimonadota bacterium]
MKHIAVTAQARPDDMTKSAVKTLRKEGRVLASVYGKGQKSASVILSASDIMRVLSAETGENTLIDLSITDKPGRVLARLIEMEMEPLTNRFRHVGLHVISATETQKASVTVEVIGEPADVHNNVGYLDTVNGAVEISALPESLVGSLTLDVSAMKVGDIKHASDLELPAGMELLSDPDLILVALRDNHLDGNAASVADATAESPVVTGITNDSSSPEEALQNV